MGNLCKEEAHFYKKIRKPAVKIRTATAAEDVVRTSVSSNPNKTAVFSLHCAKHSVDKCSKRAMW